MTPRAKSAGFTLVELAVVVVVIALLLTTISTVGPRLVEQARAKELLKLVMDLRSASQQFRERYRFLPGDFPASTNEFPAGTCVPSTGDANGLISLPESACVGAHLAAAGLIPSAQIQRPDGVIMQILSYAEAQTLYTTAIGSAPGFALPARVQNVVLLRNVQCAFALAIDQGLDDGVLSTGNGVISLSPACSGITPIWLAVAL